MLNKYYTDAGLLAIRLGIGIMFMIYGFPKISGGTTMWANIGVSMGNIGIHFAPTFWGFMAALAEFGGGLCLVLGILFRPALAMLIFTMIIAGIFHHKNGDGLGGYSHALDSAIVFIGLFIAGPGKYALRLSRR